MLNAQPASLITGSSQGTGLPAGVSLCGLDKNYIMSHASNGTVNNILPVPISSFDPSAIKLCGKFQIYYEDLLPANLSTQTGFNDAVWDTTRQNTLCAVLTYIQSVIDFSQIPNGQYVRLYVERSSASYPGLTAPPGTGALASCVPNFLQTSSGITNGYINSFVVSHNDPAPADYHAFMHVNFDQTFTNNNTAVPVNFYNYSAGNPGNCQNDLFSTLLHEMGHGLGWLSLIECTASNVNSLTPNATYGSLGLFTGLDNSFYAGTLPGALTKVITSNGNGGYILNTSLLANNNYWVNGLNAPDNLPVFSGQYRNIDSKIVHSYFSHLDVQYLSYSCRHRISPGDLDYSDYLGNTFNQVMGPYGVKGQVTRTYSKGELNTFRTVMGYTLNNNYLNGSATVNTIINNKTPYCGRMASYSAGAYTGIFGFNNLGGPLPDAFEETVAADQTITNNGTQTVILDLTNPATLSALQITDGNGDPIYVYPNSIVNFRGCGGTGNDHSRITTQSNSSGYITKILYTPRADFYGRAQLGFSLFDGKEKGSFVVYTIDVKRGANIPLAITPGANMVLNGGFESGIETKTVGSSELIPNTSVAAYIYEQKLGFGNMSDSHPYNTVGDALYPGFGDIIRDCNVNCNNATTVQYEANIPEASWPSTTNSLPGTGSRYEYNATFTGGYGSNPTAQPQTIGQFYYLAKDPQQCKRYILEFDGYSASYNSPGGTYQDELRIGFLSDLTTPLFISNQLLYNYVVNQPVTSVNSYPSVTLTSSWQHYKIPFYYCSAAQSNILSIMQGQSSGTAFHLDSLSLKEDLNPPPLTVSIANASGANCETILSAVYDPYNLACSVSFSWSNGTSVVGTGSSITIPPNTGGTYTLTLNDGCRTATAAVNVPSNGLLITVNPAQPTICPGQSAQLTASGATNYSWSPSSTLSAATGASVTATPSATTTYSVTGTASGCSGTALVTVNVGNPVITATATPASIVFGGYSILSATGAASYTWNPGSLTGSPVLVSPTGTTTYTVTGTNPGGCSSTAQVTVNVVTPPSCSVQSTLGNSYTTLSGTISSISGPGPYFVQSNLTITGNISLSNVNMLIAPNVTITIAPNAQLSLNNCHLSTCPNSTDMWQGIVLGNTNSNIYVNNSMIEDARIAIAELNPLDQDVVSITNSVFNRNSTAVDIENCNYGMPSGSYPFTVTNSVFTSRNLSPGPATYPSSATLSSYAANGNLPPYYIDPTYTRVACKDGSAAAYGIYLNKVGNGGPGSYTETTIGNAALTGRRNLFDNLQAGVKAVNSHFSVYNTSFIRMQGGLAYGIDASADPAQVRARVRLMTPAGSVADAGNKFYECNTAASINGYYDVTCNNALIASSNIFSPYTTPANGINGFIVKSANYTSIGIGSNTISNIANGIYLGVDNNNTGADYLGSVNIGSNTISITNSYALNPATTNYYYGTQGIKADNLTNCSSCPGTGAQVVVSGNTITGTSGGIMISNFKQQQVNCNNNSVAILSVPPFSPSPFARVNNQDAIGVYNCSKNLVNSNTVSTLGGIYDNSRGIYNSMNANPNVSCNITNSIGRGFEFAGNQTQAIWNFNSMQNELKGFVLSSAVLGDQGSQFAPYDNTWQGSWNGGANYFQTYTSGNTDPWYSKLFVLNTSSSIYNPATNGGVLNNNIYSTSPSNGHPTPSINVTGIKSTINSCPDIIRVPGRFRLTAEAIATGDISYPQSGEIMNWMSQMQLYQSLVADPSLTDSSIILENFVQTAANSRYAWLTQIEDALGSSNYLLAQNLLANPMAMMDNISGTDNVVIQDGPSANDIVNNYTSFYNLYLKVHNVGLDNYDSLLLDALAQRCPITDGAIIYQARTLYSYLYDLYPTYMDGCFPNDQGDETMMRKTGQTITQRYILSPNPNSGTMQLAQVITDEQPVATEVKNAIGETVFRGDLYFKGGGANLKLGRLASGIYLLQLRDCKGNSFVLKFNIK